MFNILTANLVLNTVLFWAMARYYLMSRLRPENAEAILIPIMFLHAARHLGLMFLSPGATYPAIPEAFAFPAAIGDFIAALLAAVTLGLIVRQSHARWASAWIFNLWGTIDLAAAITLATYYDAEPSMGPAYWIPAFWVPALLVTHYVTFVILIRHWREAAGYSISVQGRQV